MLFFEPRYFFFEPCLLFGTREYAVRCVVLGAEVPGHCQLTPTLIVCWWKTLFTLIHECEKPTENDWVGGETLVEAVCVTLVLHGFIYRLEFFLVDSVCIGILFFPITALINWVVQVLVDQAIDSELLSWQEELTLVDGYFIFQWLNGKHRVYS